MLFLKPLCSCGAPQGSSHCGGPVPKSAVVGRGWGANWEIKSIKRSRWHSARSPRDVSYETAVLRWCTRDCVKQRWYQRS